MYTEFYPGACLKAPDLASTMTAAGHKNWIDFYIRGATVQANKTPSQNAENNFIFSSTT